MNKIYRQGDVIIKQINEIPKKFKYGKEDMILAHGEVTGHAHRIKKGEAKLYADIAINEAIENYDTLVLNVVKETELYHEEHESITLPPGKYEITIQKEFDWFSEEIRKVQD